VGAELARRLGEVIGGGSRLRRIGPLGGPHDQAPTGAATMPGRPAWR
jgi:hypothetical protein